MTGVTIAAARYQFYASNCQLDSLPTFAAGSMGLTISNPVHCSLDEMGLVAARAVLRAGAGRQFACSSIAAECNKIENPKWEARMLRQSLAYPTRIRPARWLNLIQGRLWRVAAISALVAVAASLSVAGARAEETLTFAGWGGVAQEATSKAVWQPTATELGIMIKEDTSNGLTDVRTQVKAGAVQWDIVLLTPDMCAQGEQEGLFADLNYNIIDRSGFPEGTYSRTYIGQSYYSNVVAWSTAKFGNDGPQSWADFWNVDRFPGTRSLRNYPAEVLEAALLADGVDPSKLYPLDIDRAFESLAKIKPYISVWWSSGGQAMQLLKDGEVDLIGIWNGRAEAAIADGAQAAFTFNNGIIIPDCLVIPKGSQHEALAMQALAKGLSPELSADMTKYINYGPVNAKAFDTGRITPEALQALNSSPDNLAKQIVFQGAWWAEHGTEVLERWDTFLQE